jgi:hypothetical protein
MKKQLLIAAVAATMGTAAMADISLTGGMKVNYKNTDTNGATTDKVTQEADLVLTGTNGDTKVHVEVSIDGGNSTGTADSATANNMRTEDVWLSTKIGDVAVKTGTWNSGDTIFTGNATRTTGNWILSTDVSGVAVALEGDTETSATKTTLSGDIAGVSAKYSKKTTSDELFLSGDVSGFGISYGMINADATTSDANYVVVSKEFNGVTATYSTVDADTSYTVAGDTGSFGDAAAIGMTAGDDATSIKFSTSIGGNKVSARFVSVDIDTNTVAGDQDADFDVNTFQVTRPLAGGTTLEVTYTDTDKTGSTSDTEVLDIELAVKF